MANKTNNYQIAGDITLTTTGNIDDLDVKGYSLIRMNNASLATIRGIRAGYAGQVITFVSVGAGHVYFAHQNSNSSAANRLINAVTSGITPIAAGVGAITYRYDAETLRWRLVNHFQGKVIPIDYNAGDFTASGVGGTWDVGSGDLLTYGYYLKGNELSLGIVVTASTITGASNAALVWTIPNGWTFSQSNRGNYLWINNATTGSGLFSQSVGGTQVFFFLDPFGTSNWAISANNSFIYLNNFAYIN